jgi:protein-L-isoaspartate(D-aspartate) O-methyltransferase
MRYDGRWRAVADAMVRHYGLETGARILDVGCGKGFLLHDFTQALPGVEVAGLDISDYAVAEAKEEVRPFLQVGHANALPFPDRSFDLVISITTLHNLQCFDLDRSAREIERVSRKHKYIVVESYRNEEEKANSVLAAHLRILPPPRGLGMVVPVTGYTGDWSFIYFE